MENSCSRWQEIRTPLNVRRRSLLILTTAWVLAAIFGFHALLRYKARAGTIGRTPEIWPTNEVVSLSSNKPLLLMFAHPKCPCSRASIGELESLLAKGKGQFDAAIFFYQPESGSQDWSRTALVETARSLPGARVMADPDGQMAKRFGAETSGHTIVYGPDGKLLFSGGITASRGHLGDNTGFEAVLKILRNEKLSAKAKTAPVFGCGLFDVCTTTPMTPP
jgi:hypothetical protein